MNYVNNPEKISELVEWQRANPVFCEKLLAYWYGAILESGSTFIDVGARVGHHFVPMSRKVGVDGTALAVEANNEVAVALQEKVKSIANLPKNSTIKSVAVSDAPGTLEFYVRTDFQGWSSLYESHVHPSEKGEVQVNQVDVTTLDQLVINELEWTSCDFIKLDIEHAEFPALKGGQKVLSTMKPFVVFENSPRAASKLNNNTHAEFISFFEDIDYCLYDIYFNEFTAERLATDKLLPSYYLCFHKSAAEFVTGKLSDYDSLCNELLQDKDKAA